MSPTAETLLRQASMTACDYMDEAVRCIDEKFHKGYAQENPALIAAFMQTAALDFAAMFLGNHIESAASTIARSQEP